MEYRKFGNTGKLVSALGFGCMRFPVIDKDPNIIDEVQSVRLLHHAIEQGINYFDTAWLYHGGNSEPFVGKLYMADSGNEFTWPPNFPQRKFTVTMTWIGF